jgi:transcriptional regulator
VSRLELLQGTLDVIILQTLSVMGPMHGYGIARHIEHVSADQVLLNQGTIYAALVRLQDRSSIAAKWGISDHNRKAKFYSITRKGCQKLAKATADWKRLVELMYRVLRMTERKQKEKLLAKCPRPGLARAVPN